MKQNLHVTKSSKDSIIKNLQDQLKDHEDKNKILINKLEQKLIDDVRELEDKIIKINEEKQTVEGKLEDMRRDTENRERFVSLFYTIKA